METSREKIKVMVVDDSALMRKMIPLILERSSVIEVVATAMDGAFALSKAEKYRPDVITLDLDMPGMDGLTALRRLVEDFGMPVVVVSSITRHGAELAMKAFELGAMEVVSKPKGALPANMRVISEELIRKVVAAKEGLPSRLRLEARRGAAAAASPPLPGQARRAEKVVAIGASTGGPNALTYMLPSLPRDLPAAVVIVQHMPPGFTGTFASRLRSICRLEVREARDGDHVAAGRILLAPGDAHATVKKTPAGHVIALSGGLPENGHRPSIDVLFRSVASEFGPAATGVIMTGMGEDGAGGIGDIRKAGGRTIAQDEKSSVVFGMARAAINRGHIDEVVPLDEMAGAIRDSICGNPGAAAEISR